MTDPIADMLTRIRNTLMAKQPEVVLPHSKMKENLAKLLEKEGLLAGLEVFGTTKKLLRLQLKYSGGNPSISGIRRVSKPGQRLYAGVDKLPRARSGFGITVISTSRGLMTDRQARKAKVGGEVICQIW